MLWHFSSAHFFLIFPDLFLLPSRPKMYFPNYYEPGVLNWIRILYLYVIFIPASVIILYREYKATLVPIRKEQLKFFMITMIVGYGVGLVPNFLIYNIPIDPLWGIFFVVICTVPLIYGSVKYELFNVQVIAKQALVYSLAVAAVGGLITALNYSNILITAVYPDFPIWTLALVSAVLAVSASILVWRGLRKSDLLKAEFITTVTHKFRTPLTYIKWASENLSNPKLSEAEREAQVSYISAANEKLVELTNILTTASDAESTEEYGYNLKSTDFSQTVDEVIDSLENQFKMKQLKIERRVEKGLMSHYDDGRIKFIIQVLIENAIHYGKTGGVLTISAQGTHKEVIFSVHDEGLGMTREQISLLFAKFYRSDDARKLDTEGMGMGLFISARIIEKHNGRIWAESPGPGKGSTFYIALPRAK
jgi:signal transduction histidine kinase